jgi:hypothetical protein
MPDNATSRIVESRLSRWNQPRAVEPFGLKPGGPLPLDLRPRSSTIPWGRVALFAFVPVLGLGSLVLASAVVEFAPRFPELTAILIFGALTSLVLHLVFRTEYASGRPDRRG